MTASDTKYLIWNDVTRNLCIGVHRDPRFRNQVLDQIYLRGDRAVAPNPGIDVVAILNHALRARRAEGGQQAVLCCVALLLLIPSLLVDPIFYYVMLGWSLLVYMIVTIRRFIDPAPTQRKLKVTQILRQDPMQGYAWGGILGLALLTLVAMLIESARPLETEWHRTYTDQTYESILIYTEPDTAAAWPWVVTLLLVCMIFGMLKAHNFRAIDSANPAFEFNRRIKEIAKRAGGSQVVTHSADVLPFVGSGSEIATWQFALALHPIQASDGENGEEQIRELSAVPLISRVKEAITALGSPEMGQKRIPDLQVDDLVFVSGKEVSKPVYRVRDLNAAGAPYDSPKQIQEDPTSSVRHYLRCQVLTWGGELVTSVFVHCAMQGETLYVEFSSCVLPPTFTDYQLHRNALAFGADAVVLGAIKGAALSTIALGRSVFDIAAMAVREIVHLARADLKPGDCGARTSIRQLGTGDREHNYFQYRDSVKYTEILERQILQTITVHLRESGIDTTELGERVTAIVNYGVINYGRFSAGSVGSGSNAHIGVMGDGGRGSASAGR